MEPITILIITAITAFNFIGRFYKAYASINQRDFEMWFEGMIGWCAAFVLCLMLLMEVW